MIGLINTIEIVYTGNNIVNRGIYAWFCGLIFLDDNKKFVV
jgi:hypothetical protein